LDILTRARDILSSRGKNISEKDAIVASLAAIIEKRDPMKKAERAEKRAAQKSHSGSFVTFQSSAPGPNTVRQQVSKESSAPGPNTK
jgi:hypothetical protein